MYFMQVTHKLKGLEGKLQDRVIEVTVYQEKNLKYCHMYEFDYRRVLDW
jgi:hypothetical protein